MLAIDLQQQQQQQRQQLSSSLPAGRDRFDNRGGELHHFRPIHQAEDEVLGEERGIV